MERRDQRAGIGLPPREVGGAIALDRDAAAGPERADPRAPDDARGDGPGTARRRQGDRGLRDRLRALVVVEGSRLGRALVLGAVATRVRTGRICGPRDRRVYCDGL